MDDVSNPYFIAYMREKKARREVEQLLEDSTRQLYKKNKLLEQQLLKIQQQQQSIVQQEKLATLGTLAAGVAHEINNPLAFVISNVDTLSSYTSELLNANVHPEQNSIAPSTLEMIAEDFPELITDTVQGLTRIKDIVRNLLFFARTDTELMSDMQLRDALELALKLLGPKLKNVLLTQQLDTVTTIPFNSGELNQVLINILVNAIQACESKPEKASEINVLLTQNTTHIILCIKDNGCGMDEETLTKMYDAFYTTKPVGTGTGMGMSIVLQILKQHNCEIDVQSELNIGTVVTLKFPISKG
ncbi:sensor histidine kinase [Alishewanella sp. SMS8]|uniref:sensor histidine kinase n=1 Tax=Alishewanella sp. SMS8 TaxID=2994676 RepID=UPI0027405395|nr:ATP-binding protein [Alishewanella sp. SMS8]MDP5458026.1 ATP-binding protein [Alishewanella sp. SMS8]